MKGSRLTLTFIAGGLIAATTGCGFIPGFLLPQNPGRGDANEERDSRKDRDDDRDGGENRKGNDDDDDDDDDDD